MAHSASNATIAKHITAPGSTVNIVSESVLQSILQLSFQDFHRRNLLRCRPLSRNSNFVKTF